MEALLNGARLGPYEILAPLGSGGMGHVYRAQDTRLHRMVAIKVLSPELSGDLTSRDRFEREARSIAALNHHHICTLYDVGDHAGNAFLVMELLEGQTLASRLARVKGGLPVAEALSIATAVAEALAFAHRHQIVHRDVKPANIMITPTGVKLLDFGLARLRDRDDRTGDSRTQSLLTGPQAVMGTLAYMSPEQLDGRADSRSDVFSFGAVLFEMLTARKAFAGDTTSEVIAGIVHTDPPAVSSLRAEVSRGLDRVVRRCLAKAPEARWQSMGDLADELIWIAGNADSPQDPVVARPTSRRSMAAMAAGAAAIGIVVGLAAAAQWSRPDSAPIPMGVVQFRVGSPTGMFLPPPLVPEIALSPDGRRLAFVATSANGVRQLWVRSLEDPVPQLVNRTGMVGVTWSPDGRQLAFYQSGKLWRLDLATDAASSICEVEGRFVLTPSWGANGEVLFAGATGIFAVPAAGGQPRPVTILAPGDAQHNYPVWLPDGKHFLFNRISQAGDGSVYVGSIDGPGSVEVPGVSGRALYSRGHVIYNRNETLFAQPFDAASFSVRGEPILLAKSAGQNGLFASVAVADSGVLIYGGVNSSLRSRLSIVGRDGRFVRNLGADGVFDGPSVSPDGHLVATTILESGQRGALAIIDTARGLPVKLTAGLSTADRFPLWSTDGAFIVFTSTNSATRSTRISRMALNGTGAHELIVSSAEVEPTATDWSRDGRFIVYTTISNGQNDVNLFTFAGATRQPLVTGPFDERDGRLSPDGRFLAYVSNESGREEVYVQAFPSGGRKQRLSLDGGVEPRWRADSLELFYRAASGGLMAVALEERSGQPAPAAATLVAAGIRWATRGGVLQSSTYDVMPDGRHFVVNAFPPSTALPDLTAVMNWPALLARR